MQVIKTAIPDVLIIKPKVYSDERGFFLESFNKKSFDILINREIEFVQDNHSLSTKGVLRGLHYQEDPHAQGKLIRCLAGEIYDVAVDIRKNSETFGQWVGVHLSAENKDQLWIPEGFAHGFLTLTSSAEVAYKATNYYSPDHERSILWNDNALNIEWPFNPLTVSQKDLNAQNFKDLL